MRAASAAAFARFVPSQRDESLRPLVRAARVGHGSTRGRFAGCGEARSLRDRWRPAWEIRRSDDRRPPSVTPPASRRGAESRVLPTNHAQHTNPGRACVWPLCAPHARPDAAAQVTGPPPRCGSGPGLFVLRTPASPLLRGGLHPSHPRGLNPVRTPGPAVRRPPH